MTEEYNPYIQSEPLRRQPTEYVQPQPPQNVQQPQNAQPQPPQNVQPQPAHVTFQPQGYVYPPQPTNAQRENFRAYAPKNSLGAARAFGVTSFIIGCFVILIASMIYFNFRTTITQKYYYALTWSCVTGLPAVIFGVVSLMKKTDKKVFPIIGIALAAVLMLATFITYFFMVNTAPDTTAIIDNEIIH